MLWLVIIILLHCQIVPESFFSTFFIENEIGKCIDYIFVTTNDFYVLQHATLTNSNNGYYRSDYSPVMDEMIFKKYLF